MRYDAIIMARLTLVLLAFGFCLFAAGAEPSLNPEVQEIVSQVSADRIAAIQKKLGSFGTRNIYSPTDRPDYGIGAAREWIAAQFRSYSPRLQVSFDKHRLANRTPGCPETWRSGM